MPSSDASRAPRVGLLVTCLVDAIRPRIGFALAGRCCMDMLGS